MTNRYEIDGQTVRIYLRRKNLPDIYTTIDLDDLQKVDEAIQGRWYSHQSGTVNKVTYAIANHTAAERRAGKPQIIRMHRVIADTPDHLEVDHTNHDTLDNRRQNLKNVTHGENNSNRGDKPRFQRNIKGYFWNSAKKCWIVAVHMERGKFNVNPPNKRFYSEQEAMVEANRRIEARRLLSLKREHDVQISRTKEDRAMEGCSLEG